MARYFFRALWKKWRFRYVGDIESRRTVLVFLYEAIAVSVARQPATF